MRSEELISHTDLHSLMKKFPKIELKVNMIYLG